MATFHFISLSTVREFLIFFMMASSDCFIKHHSSITIDREALIVFIYAAITHRADSKVKSSISRE